MGNRISARCIAPIVAALLIATSAAPKAYGQTPAPAVPPGVRVDRIIDKGAPKAIPVPSGSQGSTSDGPGTSLPSGRGGTSDGSGTARPGNRGGTGEGQRSPQDGGGGRGKRDLVPAAIIGAAAIIAIGSLLARERDPSSQTGPNPIAQDQLVDRLLAEGPHLANQFNMSAFAVRGFVRGGWPLLIDFEQRSPGAARLRISARDLPEIFTYDLGEVCPPPKRCLIQFRLPPEVFGDQLRPAVIAATATDADGQKTQPAFVVYALGAGPRAVGSVAIDQVTFGPPTIRVANQQTALYRFYSHSDFSNTSVEFWKVENQSDGSKHFYVDDRLIDGGIHKDQWVGMNERREWDGKEKGQKVSSGRHKIQVRAWDRAGDWVTAWSDSMVMVAQ